jgi:radical SAM superfamily enzyme YgiQ (UPF0313 family)
VADYKVAFIDLNRNFYDRHAIYCLSSVLRKNSIEVVYINELKFGNAIKKVKEEGVRFLLYSSFSTNLPLYIEFDKIIKEHVNVKSIAGGPGPTFDWQLLRDSSIDAICFGEGEFALVDYIENGLDCKRNIMHKRGGFPSDFFPFAVQDDLPFPARDLVYRRDKFISRLPAKQFLSGRGCPYDCTYCHYHAFNKLFKACGPMIRKKSVGYLISEIKDVRQKYPLGQVVFQDDTFIIDRKWFIEFCERFPSEIGVPYVCNIRANLIDEEVVRSLNKSRCICVNWSIESGNDFFRNQILKRTMTREQILETGSLLNKYKVPHRIGNLIGLPGENFDNILQTLELNIKVSPALSLANIFVPFAGLELTSYALEHNYLSEENAQNLPRNFFTKSALNITPELNSKIQRLLYLFPIFVRFPKLYLNKKNFNMLMSCPRFLLRIAYNVYFLIKMLNLYKVTKHRGQQVLILWRYLFEK